MEEITNLTVRVYGLLVKEGSIMFLREMYAGISLLKLPGGGLEFGEGTRETLEREFLEELNLKVRVREHFYTQDFFIKSQLTPQSQLLSIYYKVECEDLSILKIIDKGITSVEWITLRGLNVEDEIPLPVDKVVMKLLLKQLN